MRFLIILMTCCFSFAFLCFLGCSKDDVSDNNKKDKDKKTSSSIMKVKVNDTQFNLIKNWPSDVVCFTPAKAPISEVGKMENEEVAMYGGELALLINKFLASGGREDTLVGLQIIGTGGFTFEKHPEIKLYCTHEIFSEDIINGGGTRIEFVK